MNLIIIVAVIGYALAFVMVTMEAVVVLGLALHRSFKAVAFKS